MVEYWGINQVLLMNPEEIQSPEELLNRLVCTGGMVHVGEICLLFYPEPGVKILSIREGGSIDTVRTDEPSCFVMSRQGAVIDAPEDSLEGHL